MTILATVQQQSDVQQQVREAIREANQAAREAAQDAKQAVQDAKQAATDAKNAAKVGADVNDGSQLARVEGQQAPGTIVIPTDGGNIKINVDGSGIHVCQDGSCTVVPIHDIVPRGVVDMTYAVCASFAFIIVGLPLARAFARWLDRRGTATRQSSALSAGVQERLDAMDRNIDTVAVELERVSEGQRFTNKLMNERTQMPAGNFAVLGERVPSAMPAQGS